MGNMRYQRANPDIQIQTPVSVLVANEHLNRLDFVDFINEAVDWNPERCSISPGLLAKAVVLSTFYETRSPLYQIANRFAHSDTEFIFGSGITALCYPMMRLLFVRRAGI